MTPLSDQGPETETWDPQALIRIGEAFYHPASGEIAAFTVILTESQNNQPELVELHQYTGSRGTPVLQGLPKYMYPVSLPSERYRDQLPTFLNDCCSIPVILLKTEAQLWLQDAQKMPYTDAPKQEHRFLKDRSDFLTGALTDHLRSTIPETLGAEVPQHIEAGPPPDSQA